MRTFLLHLTLLVWVESFRTSQALISSQWVVRKHCATTKIGFRTLSTNHAMQRKEDEEPDKPSTSVDEVKKSDTQQEPRERIKIRVPKPITMVFDAIYSVWSVGIIFLGTALTCGLLLNLFGYGYRIEDGNLRVDTIEQFRMENQFQKEINSSMKDTQQERLIIQNFKLPP